MHKLIFTASLTFLFLPIFSQDWNYYEPIKARGEIPTIFIETFSNKYEKEASSISKEDDRKTRKRKDDFHKQSEFFIDEYLTSGKVFFGDSITTYCQSVLDRIIGDDTELKNSIQVLTVKSPVVNAAATANGVIFINLGLIARLESEAQLAYILSHELVHFTNDHVVDQYVEQEKIYNGEDYYKRTADDEKLTALSSYSKSKEFEADEQGFSRFYSKSGYSYNAPFEVLSLLKYSYLPFDQVRFSLSLFESEDYHFPPTYQTEQVQKITATDDYNDKNSSHPNLLKRKENLDGLVSGQKGQDFLISKETFLHCRKTARFELNQIYLNYRDYASVIYNSFLLLQEDSLNRYNRLSIMKALHGLSTYANDRDIDEVLQDYENIEGESQQVYYLFNKLPEEELAILAARYAYKLKRDFPNDESIDKLYQRIMYDFVQLHRFSKEDFLTKHLNNYPKDSLRKSGKAISDSSLFEPSERRANNKGFTADVSANYWKSAFLEFANDSMFWKDFERYEQMSVNESNRFERTSFSNSISNDDNTALGINHAVCVTPSYLKLDQRVEGSIRFFTTKENLTLYKNYLTDLSTRVDLKLEILDYKDLNLSQTDRYNQISYLKNWLSERILHDEHNVMISSFDYVKEISKSLKTPYIVKTGQITLRVTESNVASKIIGSILQPHLAILIIPSLFIPDYVSFNYFLVFDIRNGNTLLSEYNQSQSGDKADFMKSLIYYNLSQVSNQPEE